MRGCARGVCAGDVRCCISGRPSSWLQQDGQHDLGDAEECCADGEDLVPGQSEHAVLPALYSSRASSSCLQMRSIASWSPSNRARRRRARRSRSRSRHSVMVTRISSRVGSGRRARRCGGKCGRRGPLGRQQSGPASGVPGYAKARGLHPVLALTRSAYQMGRRSAGQAISSTIFSASVRR